AALALTLLLLVLVPAPISRGRLLLAGLTAAALVCIRPTDVIFAAAAFLWVAWYQPRDLAWFIPFPVVLGTALTGYNYWFFGSPLGGYESQVFSWEAASFLWGAAGTLMSPSRGLFVFTPWVAVALATAPAVAGRLKSW